MIPQKPNIPGFASGAKPLAPPAPPNEPPGGKKLFSETPDPSRSNKVKDSQIPPDQNKETTTPKSDENTLSSNTTEAEAIVSLNNSKSTINPAVEERPFIDLEGRKLLLAEVQSNQPPANPPNVIYPKPADNLPYPVDNLGVAPNGGAQP